MILQVSRLRLHQNVGQRNGALYGADLVAVVDDDMLCIGDCSRNVLPLFDTWTSYYSPGLRVTMEIFISHRVAITFRYYHNCQCRHHELFFLHRGFFRI